MDWNEVKSFVCGSWNYAPLLNNPEGPISAIEWKENHRGEFDAWAFLNFEHIGISKNSKFKLYQELHGQGTASIKWMAIFIAISEALERWAYAQSCSGSKQFMYKAGIDICDSTSGFAAFPLSAREARIRSWFEAKERWDLINWWNNKLHSRLIGENLLQIVSPIAGFTVIQFQKHEDRTIYGFAAAASVGSAVKKANRELDRNSLALKKYIENPIYLDHIYERRLIFFSIGPGRLLFMQKIHSQSSFSKVIDDEPSVKFDSEIQGPWSEFATVWRVIFEGHREDDALETFLF